jgi:CheY-like chemotaxis protein/predicted regulator of Ras-like GTPase activity (Roadblock/LC7/MglB family)
MTSAETAKKKRQILVVDDEQSIGIGILKMLNQEPDTKAVHALNGEQAQEILDQEPFDLVITDIRMPGINGIDLLKHVRSHYPNIGVIIMTAYGSPEVQEEASRRGSLYYIEKPFDLQKLQSIISDFFNKKEKSSEQPKSDADSDIQGIIPGLQLMDVVQMNCLSRMTCTLLIKNTDENKQGIICFKRGDINHAETHTASGSRSGKDAFFEIASWSGGSFETLSEVPDTVTIVDNWEQLLIESLAHVKEDDNSDNTSTQKPKIQTEDTQQNESGDTSKMLDRIMSSASADAVFIITHDGFVIDKRLKSDKLDLDKSSDHISKILPNIKEVSQAIHGGSLNEFNLRYQNSTMMVRNVESSDLMIIVISPSDVASGNMYQAIERESENLKKII